MVLYKCIFFWSALSAIIFLTGSGVLKHRGLKLRVRFRETITMVIAAGGTAGILQLILLQKERRFLIAAVIIWAVAVIAEIIAGCFIYALEHPEERICEYQGKMCVAELKITIPVGKTPFYYEMHGRFFRSTHLLHEGWNNDFHMIS